MDRFPKWHLGWIVHRIFYIPIITPYDIFQLAHQICLKLQSYGMLLGHSLRGFTIMEQPTNTFLLGWWHLVPLQNHTMVASPLVSIRLQHNRTFLCTQHLDCLLKKNIMLSLNKLLSKIPQWCIAFIMFMNAHTNFTWFHLKVTSHVHISIFSSPYHNSVRFFVMGQYFML